MSRIDTGMFPFGNYILSGRIPPVEAIHFYKSHDKWTINGGGGGGDPGCGSNTLHLEMKC